MSDDKREQILRAAIGLWADKGYAEATMRELARRASLGTSTLYGYFRSKEEIVQYLYERLNADAVARFRAEDDGETDPGLNLQRFLRIKIDLLAPHRSAWPTLMRDAIDPDSTLSPLSAGSAPTMDRSLAFFGELAARAGLEPQPTARLLWLLHIATIVYWLHDRTDQTPRLLEKVPDVVGLLPMVAHLPGLKDLLGLLDALFERPEPKVEVREETDREVDVVVIGGGPIGCLTASFLARARPRTRVLVLEKQLEPGHKIGESTLSGFCKALRSVGVPQEAMEALFYPKNGLAFWHVEGVQRLPDAAEYVLETFDETFQVERRVLDGLVLAQTRRNGVQVLQGATVDLRASELRAGDCRVRYTIGGQASTVRCRWVVDATGPSAGIARANDLWTDEGLPFQTSAAWSYWEGLDLGTFQRPTRFSRDEYTGHLCFREGWAWHIPLYSWQDAPTGNLERVYDALLRSDRRPSREQIAREHGCPVRPITSVGLVLRSDRDKLDDPQDAFAAYRRRYPALDALLAGGTLVDPYGQGPFQGRRSFRGHARRVTGDGWVLVGDAAFFVDPLVSPGLTGGAATAWRAATALAEALDAGHAEPLAAYEAFAHDLHQALERDNQLVYLSFDHPEAMALVQRLQEVDARRHFLQHRDAGYGLADTDVWGILQPSYQELQRAAWEVLRGWEERVDREVPPAEQSARDYAPMVEDLRALLDPYVTEHAELTPYVLGGSR